MEDIRFVKVENDVAELCNVGSKSELDIAVYCAIKSFMNYKTNEAYPGIELICKMLGITKPTAIKSIKSLVDANAFTIRKMGMKNIYVFKPVTVDWKPIDISFINISPTELTANEKGFIIIIRKFLYDNTDTIRYNAMQLSGKIGISYVTFTKRIQSLSKKGYLQRMSLENSLFKKYGIKFNMNKLKLRLDKIEQDIVETNVKVDTIDVRVSTIEAKLDALIACKNSSETTLVKEPLDIIYSKTNEVMSVQQFKNAIQSKIITDENGWFYPVKHNTGYKPSEIDKVLESFKFEFILWVSN